MPLSEHTVIPTMSLYKLLVEEWTKREHKRYRFCGSAPHSPLAPGCLHMQFQVPRQSRVLSEDIPQVTLSVTLVISCWPKFHSHVSVRWYGKTRVNFLANPMFIGRIPDRTILYNEPKMAFMYQAIGVISSLQAETG